MNSSQLRQFLEINFRVVPQRCAGDEVVIVCPDCNDASGNRGVNLRNGLTNCWKCGNGGHVVSLCRRHGIEIDADAFSTAGTDPEALLDAVLSGITRPKRRTSSVGELRLPHGFTPLAKDRVYKPGRKHSVYYDLIARMAERKHLKVEDLTEVGAGYTRDDPQWEPYCIFPVVSRWRSLAYWQGRAYDETTVPGKRFPSRLDCPQGMSTSLYSHPTFPYWTARVLVVVESILNVITLTKRFRELGWTDVAPVSTFRAGVSLHQWRMLMDGCVEELCLLFDHDATSKAQQFAEFGAQHYGRTSRIFTLAAMPATCGPKTDPNDDVDAAMAALLARCRV